MAKKEVRFDRIVLEELKFKGFVEAVDERAASLRAARTFGPDIYLVQKSDIGGKIFSVFTTEMQHLGFISASRAKDAPSNAASAFGRDDIIISEFDGGAFVWEAYSVPAETIGAEILPVKARAPVQLPPPSPTPAPAPGPAPVQPVPAPVVPAPQPQPAPAPQPQPVAPVIKFEVTPRSVPPNGRVDVTIAAVSGGKGPFDYAVQIDGEQGRFIEDQGRVYGFSPIQLSAAKGKKFTFVGVVRDVGGETYESQPIEVTII